MSAVLFGAGWAAAVGRNLSGLYLAGEVGGRGWGLSWPEGRQRLLCLQGQGEGGRLSWLGISERGGVELKWRGFVSGL